MLHNRGSLHLFEYVQKKHPKIGIATVYRFLKELREKGFIHSYVCNRKILYAKEKKSHCHFICEKCKKIEHFDLEKIDFIKKGVKGDICHFQLDVSGICETCRNK